MGYLSYIYMYAFVCVLIYLCSHFITRFNHFTPLMENLAHKPRIHTWWRNSINAYCHEADRHNAMQLHLVSIRQTQSAKRTP